MLHASTARTVGEGFEIVRDAIADAASADGQGVVTLSNDERFLAEFAKAHVVTKNREDYILESDVAKWAILNGCKLQNTSWQHVLLKAKYLKLGVWLEYRRIPIPGKAKRSSRDIYVGLKRLYWSPDGAVPAEDIVSGDLNSSLASDASEKTAEEEDEDEA